MGILRCFGLYRKVQPLFAPALYPIIFSTCSDEEVCGFREDCSDCVNDTSCGWCDNKCLAGNSGGPNSDHKCNLWLYNVDTCAVNCSVYTSCGACTESESGCGWCKTNGTCFSVDQDGNPANNATCKPADWALYAPQCSAAPPPNCSQVKNCSACVRLDNCGWCESNNSCVERETGQTCPIFHEITCEGGCTPFQRCDLCTQQPKCGWCGSECIEGGPNGPSQDFGCDVDWLYGNCTFNCSSLRNCSDCTDMDGICGWCSDQSTCLNIEKSKNCSAFSLDCPIRADHCDEFLNCQGCGEEDECAWCSWKHDNIEKRQCSLTGTYKDIPLSATCKVHCNGVVVRKPGLSRGAVAGIVIAVVFGAMLAFAVVAFIYKRYSRRRFEQL